MTALLLHMSFVCSLGLPRLKIEDEQATSRLEAEMPYSPERMDEMFQQLALPGVWAIVGESWKGI